MKSIGFCFVILFAVRVDWLSRSKNLDSLTDQELISKYRSNEETRWLLAFLGRHRDLIVVRTLNYLKDEEETEDFIGNLYIKLAESLKKEQHSDNHKAWLRRTITNSLIDQSRRNKLHDTFRQTQDSHAFSNPFSSLPEADAALARQAIEQLHPLPRLYVIKHFFEGKQNKEIVEETGLNMNQIRGARDRALKALKESLGLVFEDYFED